jgi:hypothetical protein
MNRRQFLQSAAATSVIAEIPGFLFGQSAAPRTVTLSINSAAKRIPLPSRFTGLSYESAQLGNPGYFSADNKELISLVRQLGIKGVLRIGGSTSDFDHWAPRHIPRTASWFEPANPDTGENAVVQAVVTETAIDELRTFLDATGWSLIYGIDLGHGSPEQAADEAAYVVQKIGPALMALQIGNEPDLFPPSIRSAPYGFDEYFKEWQRFATAIRQRTPSAPLAGPDIADAVDWVDAFAKRAHGISLLTSHYYAEGPPESPASDIRHLLQDRPELQKRMEHLVAVGRSAGLPYRMAEGNSCYNGGKPGVSDSFASALWGADFMLLLAELGVSGVNFHGGGHGYYTPIAGGGHIPLEWRPLYYGMLFYREFASGSLIPCRLDADDVNATAYACHNSDGRLAIAIINKDLERDLQLTLSGGVFTNPSREMTLRAPSVDSRTVVTLGGKGLSTDGIWHGAYTPGTPGRELTIPRTSALLIEFDGVQL